MQLKELSSRSGVSGASIKFYLREGLLAPGSTAASPRADYGPGHLRRLELIKTLRGVVGLGLAGIKEITGGIDDPGLGTVELMGRVQSIVLGLAEEAVPDHPLMAGLVGPGRWADASSRARNSLNLLLHRMDELGVPANPRVLAVYAAAVDQVAALDVGHAEQAASRDELAGTVAVGTHLYGELLLKMLAVAQASRAIRGPEG
ncbi:MerR family transcriptional regulator [Zafaria cholistanensis]|uniref:MerR family transcriptional regulator n=1 Tax=Zafaria cholistanensis TaxID=1682741 RepID=A0A5A7NSB2_9MICC|nr:MerR family transcriptional regulator [Zafaria cholistanensis]GER23002.1 MerR family transcriptional regulator [Zafaria cholistanensis]